MNISRVVRTSLALCCRTFCPAMPALAILVFLGPIFGAVQISSATTTCVFVQTAKALTLQGPCTTDEPILIPNNLTLNGQGFKITAIDPPAGNFVGPIVKTLGKAANVNNLFLRTNLADVCNADADKVIGILFDHAAGTISGVNITINKAAGTSTCSEGVAVQVQALPYSPKAPFSKVSVKNSTFKNNQFASVVASGNVSLRVDTNLIKDDGAADPARQGVAISDGAKSYIINNLILRISHLTLNNEPSYGILLLGAGSSTVLTNTLNYDDIAIRLLGTSKTTVKGNIIRSSTLDGILLDDANAVASATDTVWGNDVQKSGGDGIHLQSVNGLVTKNIVKSNLASRNTGNGLMLEGSLNKAQVNTADTNGVLDISDAGSGNLYSKNVCTTSSGAPVDCGTP